MPDHWQQLTLGDVLTHRPGKYLMKDDYAAGGEFAVYGSNSVMGSHSEALFDGPLVVMAGIGAYAGAVRLSKVPCWVNNNAFAIFARENTDTEWLYLWLDDALDLGLVRKATAQPYIDKSVLVVHPVLLPSLDEQRRIVDLVGSIDTYIDSLETQIETTRTARSALLSELLSNPGGDWQETTLGEVVALNSESVRGQDEGFKFRYVDIGSVSASSGISTDSLESHELGTAPSRAQRIIRSADVLVSTVRPNLRAFAQVPAELDGEVASTGFAVLRAGDRVEPGFVWVLVRSEAFVGHLIERATGSNYPAVKSADVGSFAFALPPITEQRRIADLVGSFDEQISSLESQIETVRALRSGVLSELLSGERLLDESYDVAVGL